jgi:cephalosporin hydroxylase
MQKHLLAALAALLILTGAACRKSARQPAAQASRITEVRLWDKASDARLLDGILAADGPGRWTKRGFSFSIDPPPTATPVYVELDFAIPPELMEQARSVTLFASVNGTPVGSQVYFGEGHHQFTRFVPADALKTIPAVVRFDLDRSFNDRYNGAEKTLIVVSATLCEYEATIEYRNTQTWLARDGFRKVVEQNKREFPASRALELRRFFLALPGWKDLVFQGVPVTLNPLDSWMIQQIIYEVQPEVVVETGAGPGGTALFWAQTLDGMDQPRARVVTVGRKGEPRPAAQRALWKKYVDAVEGDAADAAVAAQVAKLAAGRKAVVVLDSDHESERLLEELAAYSPLVPKGSYLIVNHTEGESVDSMKTTRPTPSESIRRFLGSTPGKEFEADNSREMLILGSNPGGWLRRK